MSINQPKHNIHHEVEDKIPGTSCTLTTPPQWTQWQHRIWIGPHCLRTIHLLKLCLHTLKLVAYYNLNSYGKVSHAPSTKPKALSSKHKPLPAWSLPKKNPQWKPMKQSKDILWMSVKLTNPEKPPLNASQALRYFPNNDPKSKQKQWFRQKVQKHWQIVLSLATDRVLIGYGFLQDQHSHTSSPRMRPAKKRDLWQDAKKTIS